MIVSVKHILDNKTTKLTCQEYLVFLTLKHRYDWAMVQKDLENKIEVDTEEARTLFKKILKDVDADTKFVTLVDPEYPMEMFKGESAPPFVLQFKGNITELPPLGKTVVVENDALSAYLTKENIPHSYYNIAEQATVIIPAQPASKDTKKPEEVTSIAWVDPVFSHVAKTGKIFLAIDGETQFAALAQASTSSEKLMALPGRAGCACNQLIKRGWHLCDCAADLRSVMDNSDTETTSD